jgi:ADP-ribose pyrophosphatase
VVLLHQFRIGALAGGKAGWQTEIVAGVIEPGESPEAVARREAVEESGVAVERLEPIHHYLVSPGGTTETVRLYCALVDSRRAGGIHGLDAEHEDIKVEARPWPEAWAMLQDGTIDNAPAIIALQWLALNRDRLRASTA